MIGYLLKVNGYRAFPPRDLSRNKLADPPSSIFHLRQRTKSPWRQRPRNGLSLALIPIQMITAFAPRISRNDVIRVSLFLVRFLSLGAAFAYAFGGR